MDLLAANSRKQIRWAHGRHGRPSLPLMLGLLRAPAVELVTSIATRNDDIRILRDIEQRLGTAVCEQFSNVSLLLQVNSSHG